MLLLDEPTAGMNPQETEGTRRLILKIRELGVSVVVIEHDIKFIFTCATVCWCSSKASCSSRARRTSCAATRG